MTTNHVLYRFYSATGQLLYVGKTVNPPARFNSHRRDKDWWSEVSGITVETYDSAIELTAAERRAIQIEHPQHNVVHNGRFKLTGVPMSAIVSPTPSYDTDWLKQLATEFGSTIDDTELRDAATSSGMSLSEYYSARALLIEDGWLTWQRHGANLLLTVPANIDADTLPVAA